MEGNCFNFAIALQRRIGGTFFFLYGERDNDGDTEKICIHVLLNLPSGQTVDFEGVKGSASEVLDEYLLLNEPYDYFETLEISSEDELEKLVKECGGDISVEAIREADKIIDQAFIDKIRRVSKIISALKKS